jgi:hypothetical protein
MDVFYFELSPLIFSLTFSLPLVLFQVIIPRMRELLHLIPIDYGEIT